MNKHLAYNEKVKKEFEHFHGMTLKEFADRSGAVYLSKAFSCIECGKQLPYPVIKFFDYDITKVKCYDCQGFNSTLKDAS